MNILGLNIYHGDASAALVQSGKLVAACEEERLNRIKHCAGLPHMAAAFCLQQGKITAKDVDYIAVSRNPGANFFAKAKFAVKQTFKDGNFFRSRMGTLNRVRQVKHDLALALGCGFDLDYAKVVFVEHH